MSAVIEFRLPDVGEGLEEAEVVQWLVAEGASVVRDQAVVEIQTDKALVEIPAPAAGVVARHAVATGVMLRVGDLLFVLDGDNGEVPAEVEAKAARAVAPPRPAPSPRSALRRVKAAPAVRRLATELGVDLATVAGSGPSGRVEAADVRARVAAPAAAAEPSGAGEPREGLGQALVGNLPLVGLRRATAEIMTRAWREIPHIHGSDEIDATALLDLRRRLQDRAGESRSQLTVTVFLVLAAARALKRYPLVNASISSDARAIEVHGEVNIGFAAATPDGLVVPVVKGVDTLGLPELAREMERLRGLARSRKATPDDLRGGSFTVTNYGSLGGRFATPILLPPQVGILGFGAIRERAIAVAGRVEARPTLPICFGADHRVIDGDLSVAFQETVKDLLSRPAELLIDPRHFDFKV
ncbi:MAG: dihydrolipoamide acetyltransferase family protein [Acidobacteriota bacterium]|nr:dihydrolipoamide acetyltransferase family protein [Acidobacteriota bacterium]